MLNNEKQPIIRVEKITKHFTSTRALNEVSLEVCAGQVMGLIGENGSGKSTLASIISGNLEKDSGEMFFMGKPYLPKDSFDASEIGVTMIVQEQGTIATIPVGANIFAGRENQFIKYGLLNSKKLNEQAKKLLQRIGVDYIRPEAMTSTLSLEDRKLVEIARAFYKMPELFIVDETTTALPQKGRDILHSLIFELKKANKAVLFISHDIDELISVCDSVTILRDGNYIATLDGEEMQPPKMKALMVGREVTDNYYRSDYECSCLDEKPVFKVENVSCGILKNISFELKKGEILGFAGLSDCGIHEVGRLAFGRVSPESGSVSDGDGNPIKNPKDAIKKHIGYVSKNRDAEALLSSASIKDNVVLSSLDRLKKLGFFITRKSEKEFTLKWCKSLAVKMRDMGQSINELSGGNKQKIVLAKWLGNESEIFILDCPTRGIDVGVKEAIYSMMGELKAQGKSIIMISEELPEVIGMSDRILAVKDGRITKELLRSSELNESEVIQYMI
ncbi:MAG: sugar ABC transporter ATP-binding protein [Oscillospiraceae bacterium]|jgi:ribose transport system ATP-binding protein